MILVDQKLVVMVVKKKRFFSPAIEVNEFLSILHSDVQHKMVAARFTTEHKMQ